ncbi:sigma-70 family RNA polymerase sigma factor [Catenuloplanes indicus]|uniref:RNA polymerase sigma factor (Sigma-70 family) n=1 Tax=Catenuloplanes indicus TaxID=137267 RepID=A0AAE3W2V6_9ACTN|nr:sigma-70 family RNA polymerase sigma factor [Catenuloplanes indicus]MDQ0368541.1 RNA polymerase sigma factor (sigma-70 family) [Catenuloplanes indicus]
MAADPAQDPYAYAPAVLVNHVRDGWRRPIREYATAEPPDRPESTGVAGEVNRRRWPADALALLTPRERMVIVLRHYFDLTEVVVAEELGVTVGAVKSTNARALQKLRSRIGEPALKGGLT